MEFKAPHELWNPFSQALLGKFNGSDGQSKTSCLQDLTILHRSWAWQIVSTFNTAKVFSDYCLWWWWSGVSIVVKLYIARSCHSSYCGYPNFLCRQVIDSHGMYAKRVIGFHDESCHIPAPSERWCMSTHWGLDKMADIFQTTFWNGFSWMKLFEYRLKFHWSLFLRSN